MGVTDIITRVDAICKKYEKYDVDKYKDKDPNNVVSGGDDAFARLHGVVEKSDAAANEKDRATVVALNAEIRRTKARLLGELPKLQRLALKKVKGLSKEEELEARNDLVSALKERIEAIPDGFNTSVAKQTGGWTASASYTGITIDLTSGITLSKLLTRVLINLCNNYKLIKLEHIDNEYFQQTEELDRFKQEYEMRRMKQDQGLDVIAEGLDTLKNMAHDMNEEFDRQAPLMDEIDDKVDRATTDLTGANVRLKEKVTQLRSSRNFCIDIILLSICCLFIQCLKVILALLQLPPRLLCLLIYGLL